MDRKMRRRLAMFVRVRDFFRAHPSDDPNQASLLVRLEEAITAIRALIRLEQTGKVTFHAASEQRANLRRKMHNELVRHLVTVAEFAAAEAPELAQRFRMPSTNAGSEAFRAAVQRMHALGVEHRELLTRHGLSPALLDDLSSTMAQYEVATAEINDGRRAHTGAREALATRAEEVMLLVSLLDGLYRYRFPEGSAELRAWVGAKDQETPAPHRDEEDGGGAGEVKPAA